VNTRSLQNISGDWINTWAVEFVEPSDIAVDSLLDSSSGGPSISSIYTKYYPSSAAFSKSFEDFAQNFVITDDQKEDQCERAREELGFDKDHPYDLEVRDKFNEYACDIHFTGVDHLSEGLSEPPTFTEVEFEAPEYPEDAELHMKKLPVAPVLQKSGDIGTANDHLNSLQDAWLAAKHILMVADHVFNVLDDNVKGKCKIIPDTLPAPMTCLFNPARIVCEGVSAVIVNVARAVWAGIHAAHDILDSSFEKETLGPGDELDTFYRVKDLHENVDKLSGWNHYALETINTNVFRQHSEMRKHLQDRHQEMTSDIVEIIEDSTNVIAGYFKLQSEWLHDNLCTIYKKVMEKDDCAGNDTLMSQIGVSLWVSVVGLEAQGNVMSTALNEVVEENKEMKNDLKEMKEMKHDLKEMKDYMKELIEENQKMRDMVKDMMGILPELVEQKMG